MSAARGAVRLKAGEFDNPTSIKIGGSEVDCKRGGTLRAKASKSPQPAPRRPVPAQRVTARR